jgi:hypothetical protein
MDDQPSFRSTLRFIRDSTVKRTGHSKAAMAFFAASMLFVLAFPTMASAMTGYRANSGAFVTDSQKNMIAINSFAPVAYVVHDGLRINLTDNYMVAFASPSNPSYRLTESTAQSSRFILTASKVDSSLLQ